MFKVEIHSLSEINFKAQEFMSHFKNNYVFAFYGEMGVGKTTFIQALCQQIKVSDNVNSPSFAIINEYDTSNMEKVYHFDFYRIKNIEEALDIGSEEYFYSNHYCFIEWAEKVDSLLPEDTVKIKIKKINNKKRELIQI